MLFKLNNPEEIILKSSDYYILRPVFGPENKKLYFSCGIVEYLNLDTKETKEVFRMPEKSIIYLSILNTTKG